jgi:CubicO group peptidase (beta-lactamase class C family)
VSAPPAAQRDAALQAIGACVGAAIGAGRTPGAVVHVGWREGGWTGAFGLRDSLQPPVPAEASTVYDCASLTKVVVTAPVLARLMHEGALAAATPVRAVLPAFRGGDAITVGQLLTHTSGLEASLRAEPPWSGAGQAVALACASLPTDAPGTLFRYSDINFVLLAAIAERLTGQGLERLAREWVLEPLGMHDSGFLPLQRLPATRIAPTARDEAGTLLCGVVHDPTARRMGGVAGHAGLFSTAGDLARFARAVLGGGALDGRRVLPAEAVRAMTAVATPATLPVQRSLGWDIDSPHSRARGSGYAGGSFGHTGFTGCALWIDPAAGGFHVLLSNRVHPVARDSIVDVYEAVATQAARAILCGG